MSAPSRRGLVALLVGALLALAALTGCSSDAAKRPDTLPDLTLPAFADGGESVTLSDLRGPMVINAWASWCPPCRKELPIAADFAREHPEVKVLGINYTELNRDYAQRLIDSSKVEYPNLRDDDGEINGNGGFPRMPGLPLWLVIDEHGKIVHHQFVEIHEPDDLVEMVTNALPGVLAGDDAREGAPSAGR